MNIIFSLNLYFNHIFMIMLNYIPQFILKDINHHNDFIDVVVKSNSEYIYEIAIRANNIRSAIG